MKIELDHNAAEVAAWVRWIQSDQLPFVEAASINDSAKEAQRVQREHQERVFEIRRPTWFKRGVKIKPFATKRSPEAKIQIDPPGGQERSAAIIRHEEDLRRYPFGSSTKVAVPTEHVTRTATGVVRSSERPGALEQREAAGARPRAARRRTFRKGDTIFEELQDRSIRPLWQLVPSTDLDQRLDFVENVVRTVEDSFPRFFTERFDQATRRTR